MKKLPTNPQPFRGFRFITLALILVFPFNINHHSQREGMTTSFQATAAFWSVRRDVHIDDTGATTASWQFHSPVVEKVSPAVEAVLRAWLSNDTAALEQTR